MDKITLLALVACCGALWLWNWSLMRIVRQHERKLLELQAWIKILRQRPDPEPKRPTQCDDPHAIECSSCQRFLDENCETIYDCSCCYECHGVGGCWKPRKETGYGAEE